MAKFLHKFYAARPDLNTSNTWFISVYNGLGDAFLSEVFEKLEDSIVSKSLL